MFEKIPEELQEVPNWIIYILKPKEKDPSKFDKIPYQARNLNFKASSTNPATWTTFDEASGVAESMTSEYGHGIGFVFTPPYFGIDLDKHVVNGKVSDFAFDLIKRFQTYTELSPSGTGLHIIGNRADAPDCNRRADNLGIECYTSERFFTMTGKWFEGSSPFIEQRNDVFIDFVSTYWPPVAPSSVNLPNNNSLTPQEVVARASGDDKFFALQVEGDLSAYDGDHSRADGALCMKLAFYSQRNPAVMDAIFRKSRLMRPKWDEKRGGSTYGEYQINNAIAACSEVYDLNKFDKPDEPPTQTQEDDPSAKINADILYAARFLKSNTIVYCPERKLLYQYGKGFYSPICDEAIEKNIIMDSKGQSFGNTKRNNIIKNIKVLSHQPLEKFNNGSFLTFQNVTINTETLTPHPHSPEILNTISIKYNYDALASCPNWIKFLNSSLENDREKIAIIQEFFGYCLQRSCKHEKALFLLGRGQNGKGTLIYVLEHLLGSENCAHASLKQLSEPEGRGVIVDKMVNIDSELSTKSADYEDSFKKISSGEYVDINEKYVPQYSYQPFCKLIFCANDMPHINDFSYGFYRRFIPISFDRVFTEDERDIELKEKLLSELSGVFNWAIEGLRRLNQQKKFTQSQSVVKFISDIEKENKPILQFIADYVVMDEESWITKTDLYIAYERWCKESGHRGVLSKTKFGRYFYESLDRKIEKDAKIGHDKTRVWKGVRFRTQFDTNVSAKQEWDD